MRVRAAVVTLALVLSAPAVASAAVPDTFIDSGPPTVTNAPTATFTFHSDDAGATFECKHDSTSFGACTSPRNLSNLPEGPHTFSVRAVDGANTDPTPATQSWTTDYTPPATTVSSQPPALTNSPAARFEFSSSDPSASFRCSLNGASAAPCTSPVQYSGLGDGTRTLLIQAVDPAGNVDTSATPISWTVDVTPPDTTLADPGNITASPDPQFSFTSSEANSTFECALGSSAFAPCTSPDHVSVPKSGDHRFRVRAVDAAGNVDPTPAVHAWTSDVTPPRRPKVHVLADPSASAASVTATPTPTTVTGVTPVDPITLLSPHTPLFTLTSRLRAQWSSDATAVSYNVTVTTTPDGQTNTAATVKRYDKLKRTALVLRPGTGNTVCVAVAALDKPGNVSKITTACTAIPYSFAPPSQTGSIKRVKAHRSWHGYYLVLKKPALIFVPIDQGGYGVPTHAVIVAERCASCGTLKVGFTTTAGLSQPTSPITKLSEIDLTASGSKGQFKLITIKLHVARLRQLSPGYLVITAKSGAPHIAGFGSLS